MKGLYCCLAFLFSTIDFYGQAPFASAASGDWNVGATWGRAGNVAGTDYPIAGQAATISGSTTVTVPSGTFGVGNLSIANSATAILNISGGLQVSGAITGGIARGALNVNNGGRLILNDGATVQALWSRLFVKNGGALEMNYSSGGTAPACTYETGSILRFTGYTSASAVTPVFESGILIQNLEWNCPSQGNDIFLNGAMPSLAGYLKVISTGPVPWWLVLTSTTPYTATIGGDFQISNGGYVVLTDGTAAATVTVNGNTSIIDAGSGLDLKQSTGIGTLNLKGDFTLTNGTVQVYPPGAGELVFNGNVTQNFNRTAGTISGLVNYTVFDFSRLDLKGNALTGSGNVTLNGNATLYVGSTDVAGAIQLSPTGAGNIQVSGTRTYSSSSNIVYNGTGAQKLGNGFPLNVNLEINNNSGVTNDNVGVTNFVGNLTLTAGPLNIGSSNTLDIQSNFFTTQNGSLGGDATSNLTFSGSGTLNTLRLATGKESLNNLTVSRVADLVLGSNLTINGAIDLSGGNLDFSGHSLTMNGGSITSNATGLKSDNTSNLIFGGSSFAGSVPFSGAGNQLNTLTFATNGGAYTWNSGVTVNGSLNLTAGALSHTSGITMAANSTVFKGAGTVSGSTFVAASSYNVTYTGTGSTGLELPSSSTALNNLTVQSSGTLNLMSNITVNGDIVFGGGTFAAGANTITMKGANWTTSGGLFTAGTGTVTFSGTTAIGGTGSANFYNLSVASGASLTLPSNTVSISHNVVNNGTITKGTGTVTFAGTTAITGTGTTGLNNVVINSASSLTAPSSTLSIAGDLTNSGTFTHNNGIVVFNGNSSIGGTVPTFNTVTVTGILDAPSTLALAGNLNLNNGTFTHNNGTVIFNGTGAQNLNRTSGTGSATYDLYNLTIDKTAGLFSVESGISGTTFRVENQLTIVKNGSAATDVDFDGAGSGTLVLRSTSSRTAQIPLVQSGTTVTGNITVERYIPNTDGIRAYRYFAPPVAGSNVADWQNEIPITGWFADPSTGAGITDKYSPSMYRWTETNGGVSSNRYEKFPYDINATAASVPLENGRGYAVYVRSTGTPILNTRGTLRTGNVLIPLTVTGAEADAAGYNLIGNPYPAPIDWDLITLPGGVSSGITLKDNVDNAAAGTGNYVYYVKGGPNVGNFTGVIASGQAFWVQTTTTTNLTISESHKASDINPIVVRERELADVLRIDIEGNGKQDESVIWLQPEATDGVDLRFDAQKKVNDYLNLYTILSSAPEIKYAINGVKDFGCSKTFKLAISDIDADSANSVMAGVYTLNFSDFESFTSDYDFTLIDKFKNEVVDVHLNPEYTFDVTTDSTSFGEDRFELMISQPTLRVDNVLHYDPVCENAGASITIENTDPNASYEVRDQAGKVISNIVQGTGNAVSLAISKEQLAVGSNNLTVFAQNGFCDAIPLQQTVSLDVNEIYGIESVQGGIACKTGSVTLKASGAPTDGDYYWYDTESSTEAIGTGSELTTPEISKSKTYFVAVRNALGCEGPRTEVKADVVQFEDASIEDIGSGILASNYFENIQWYFNDELIPDAINQQIVATESGTYTVEAQVSGCTTSASYEYLVTGAGEDTEKSIRVFPNPFANRITVELGDKAPAQAEVLNSVGNAVGAIQFRLREGRQSGEISMGSEPAGLYLIRVIQGKKTINYKVIKK